MPGKKAGKYSKEKSPGEGCVWFSFGLNLLKR
jgi:hypothetical protein